MMPAITGDTARPGRLWHAGIPRLSESRSRAVSKAGATGLNAAASSISTGFIPARTSRSCTEPPRHVNVGAGPYGRPMTASTAERAPAARLPRAYLVWRCGALVSQLGDAALYFGLGWTASAHGGPAAALVLTAVNLPQSVLLLAGGAMGTAWGRGAS